MEIRIIVDALMRPTTSHIHTFLKPSITTRRTAQSQICCRIGGNRISRQQFSSSTSRRADWSTPTTSAAPPPNTESSASSTSTSRSPKDVDVSELVGELGWAAKKRAPSAHPYENLAMGREERFNKGNTANDLLSAINQGPGKMVNRYKEKGFANLGRVPSQFSLDDMRMDIQGTPAEVLVNFQYSQTIPDSAKRALMKLGPSTGRAVEIGGGSINIERGFQLLNTSCARNQVRSDMVRQKFHERPGMKRKRLLSLRWRKKFKAGFHAAVQRTQVLRRQGW